MHLSGHKLTHTCTAHYSSNPYLGMHYSRAHQAFIPLIVISVQMGIGNGPMLMLSQTMSCRRSAKPVRQSSSDSHVDAVTDHVMQAVSKACQTVKQ